MMNLEQHAALVKSMRAEIEAELAPHLTALQLIKTMGLVDDYAARAHSDGAEFGEARERVAAQIQATKPPKPRNPYEI